MQAEKLQPLIDLIVADPRNRSPCQGTALRSGEIFYRMKAESGKVGNTSNHFPMPCCSKRMRGIRTNSDPSDRLLNLICWTEQMLFAFHNIKDPIIIAGYPAQIDRNDHFGLIGNRFLQRIVIHFKSVLLRVDQLQRSSDMTDHRRRRGIGICRGNHLIPGTNTENM